MSEGVEMMLQLKNISKKYDSDFVLEEVSMKLRHSDFLFIKGVSGVGKTTLLNLIGLLDQPTSGDVIFNEVNLTQASTKEKIQYKRNHIGIIFQKFNLLANFTVYENIMMSFLYKEYDKQELKSQIETILEQLQMQEYQDKKVKNLSGGQQQRVAIARVLLQDPDIILADEPTANVDAKTEKLIIDIFKQKQAEGKLIIVVSHNDLYKNYANKQIELTKEGVRSNL